MAVQKKCPNCGWNMIESEDGKSWKCHNCGTTSFVVENITYSSDVTVMTPEEFKNKAIITSTTYTVKFDEHVSGTDVDSVVLNKNIEDAIFCFENGNKAGLDKALEAIPRGGNLPVVDRLLLLERFEVKNEGELIAYSVDFYNDANFRNIINSPLCDAATKQAYQDIAAICNNNIIADREIADGYKLQKAGLNAKFLIYAQDMCNKYPRNMASWLMLAAACGNDSDQINSIYGKIKQCPGFNLLADSVVTHKYIITKSFNVPEALRVIIYNNDDRTIKKKKKEQQEKSDKRKQKALWTFIKQFPFMLLIGFGVWIYFCYGGLSESVQGVMSTIVKVIVGILVVEVIVVGLVAYNYPFKDDETKEPYAFTQGSMLFYFYEALILGVAFLIVLGVAGAI